MTFGTKRSQVMLSSNPASSSHNFNQAGSIFTYEQSQSLYNKPYYYVNNTNINIPNMFSLLSNIFTSDTQNSACRYQTTISKSIIWQFLVHAVPAKQRALKLISIM